MSTSTPDEPLVRRAVDQRVRVVSAEARLGTRLGEIWNSRELLANLIRSDIKVKYKNSALGIAWSMVAPAMSLTVFYFVFHFIAKNGIPNFVIYLFSGMLLWNFFQTSVNSGTASIVAHAGIVKKVSFPREVLALASVGTAGVYLFFQALVLVAFMAVLGAAPVWSALPLLALAVVTLTVLACGAAVLLAALNVRFRDVQHLVEVLLTVVFWGCPIVYSFSMSVGPMLERHGLTWLYFLNPLAPLLMTSQRVIYAHPNVALQLPGSPQGQVLPDWGWSTYLVGDLGVLAFGVVLALIGFSVFGRLEGNFAEEL